jgi:phosphatidate cytidylyltransferase
VLAFLSCCRSSTGWWAPHFDLFTVFIPVYVFLAIPVVSALADDPQRFLERNAKLQWGIMVCIYGMSHVPALLLLEFPASGVTRTRFLVFFLVLVVQTCMVVQHLVSRRCPGHHGAGRQPELQLAQLVVGVAWQRAGWGAGRHHAVQARAGVGHGLDACVAGSLGHLVMKALKRDRGMPNWGAQGAVGHRRQRPAGPGGRAVFCGAGVLSLGSMVFWGIAQRGWSLFAMTI